MINMYEMLMLMLWNVNACLTLRGVTSVSNLSLSKGATRTYQMAKGCNNTSNLLTLPLALRRGRHKPLTITEGGQEQSSTLANASKLLQAV
jgi:hypothetical protein